MVTSSIQFIPSLRNWSDKTAIKAYWKLLWCMTMHFAQFFVRSYISMWACEWHRHKSRFYSQFIDSSVHLPSFSIHFVGAITRSLQSTVIEYMRDQIDCKRPIDWLYLLLIALVSSALQLLLLFNDVDDMYSSSLTSSPNSSHVVFPRSWAVSHRVFHWFADTRVHVTLNLWIWLDTIRNLHRN